MDKTPWYKSKWFVAAAGALSLAVMAGAATSSQPSGVSTAQTASVAATSVAAPVAQTVQPPVQAPVTQAAPSVTVDKPMQAAAPAQNQAPVSSAESAQDSASVQLSNNNHYTNSDGNEVHAPAHTQNDAVPPDASAKCRDGSYSFSEHRRGTCSHHGGVATWY